MNSRGFSLTELVIVLLVMAIIGGFSFAFMHHCVQLYTMWRNESSVQMEGAVIMDRITRELRQTNRVGQPSGTSPKRYISFERQAYVDKDGNPVLDGSGNVLFPAGTPSDAWPYIQYCICETTTRRNQMYRVHIEVYNAVDACESACPGGQALMSRNVLSAASDNTSVNQGFYVTKVPGYGGNSEADRYQVTLKLTYRQPGASGGSATDGRVTYRTTVVPRNYGVPVKEGYTGRSYYGLYRSYPY